MVFWDAFTGGQPIGAAISETASNIQFSLVSGTIATVVQTIVVMAVFAFLIWKFVIEPRRWDYDVYIVAKRGSNEIFAMAKGRAITKKNEKKFKINSLKTANLPIPDLDFVRIGANGRKVVYIYKYGEDKYTFCFPEFIHDESGTKLKLIPTESVADELLVNDIRELLQLYDKRTNLDKYSHLISIIIIGIIFVVSLWIFSKNMVNAAQIISGSLEKTAELCRPVFTAGVSQTG